MVGRHLIKSWSRQQRVIALSSAEAETYGMVACSAELLGIQSCARDLGMEFAAAVYTDASAALGIVQRRGVGKVRHIRTQCLWLQEAHATRRVKFEKIDGSRNPSDLFTKHLSEMLIDRHLKTLGAEPEAGRAETAPELNVVDRPREYLYGCHMLDGEYLEYDLNIISLCDIGFENNNNNIDKSAHTNGGKGLPAGATTVGTGTRSTTTLRTATSDQQTYRSSPNTQRKPKSCTVWAKRSGRPSISIPCTAVSDQQIYRSSPNTQRKKKSCTVWTEHSERKLESTHLEDPSKAHIGRSGSVLMRKHIECREYPIDMEAPPNRCKQRAPGISNQRSPRKPPPGTAAAMLTAGRPRGSEELTSASATHNGSHLGCQESHTLKPGPAEVMRRYTPNPTVCPPVEDARPAAEANERSAEESRIAPLEREVVNDATCSLADVRQPRIEGRWVDTDSEGECQEIASLWARRRAIEATSASSRPDLHFTAEADLDSLSTICCEDPPARNTCLASLVSSFCDGSTQPISSAQEEQVDMPDIHNKQNKQKRERAERVIFSFSASIRAQALVNPERPGFLRRRMHRAARGVSG